MLKIQLKASFRKTDTVSLIFWRKRYQRTSKKEEVLPERAIIHKPIYSAKIREHVLPYTEAAERSKIFKAIGKERGWILKIDHNIICFLEHKHLEKHKHFIPEGILNIMYSIPLSPILQRNTFPHGLNY